MPMNPRRLPLPLSLRSAAGDAELELAPARSLIDNAQSGMYLVQDGLICYANPATARLLGWPEGSLAGQAHSVVVAPEFRARAELAIQRRQVKDLPLDITLDDAMAMSPALRLSTVSQVIIGARISKSGNAMAQPGDLQGLSPVVAVGSRGLQLQIGEVLP